MFCMYSNKLENAKLHSSPIPMMLSLIVMIFIDLSNSWFGIVEVPIVDKISACISRLFN